VEAFTPYGDPADITAEIIAVTTGHSVGTLQTLHEGRGIWLSSALHLLRIFGKDGCVCLSPDCTGRASFVPQQGASYALKILFPSGSCCLLLSSSGLFSLSLTLYQESKT
jgi:hypothetical protein